MNTDNMMYCGYWVILTSWNFLIILLLSTFYSTRSEILRLPQCGKFDAAWTNIYEGKCLTESTHSLVSNTSYEQCLVTCMLYPKCKSISIKEDAGLCMLHHSRHDENGTKLEINDGWVHIETDDKLQNVSSLFKKLVLDLELKLLRKKLRQFRHMFMKKK